MKVFTVFSLLFSITAGAAYAPAPVGVIPVCGMLMNPTNLIHCFGRVSGSSNRSACARAGDNGTSPSDYSAGKGPVGGSNAANGKAFRVVAVRYIVQSGNSSNSGLELWYADNDLGNTSSGTFTNGINFINVTNGNGYVGTNQNATTANNTMDQSISCAFPNWLIPNGKFPSFKGDATDIIAAEYFGYEE